jgi:dihydroorotate dehydrogenase
MAALDALPFGGRFIEWFGDLKPPPELHRFYGDVELVSPVGIGSGLDPAAIGSGALANFGAGYVEIGPVTREPMRGGSIVRDDRGRSIERAEPLENSGLEAIAATIARGRTRKRPARYVVRLAHARGATPHAALADALACFERLARDAAFVTLDVRPGLDDGWPDAELDAYVAGFCAAVRASAHPRDVVVCIPPDGAPIDVIAFAERAIAAGASGIAVGGGERLAPGGARFGAPTFAASVARVRALRERIGPAPILIGSGGIESPPDALAFFDAGATLVQIDSGLAFSGPGLAKRINDALVAAPPVAAPFAWDARWVWYAVCGAGLAVATIFVFLVAVTTVVLPYDEVFLRMSRARIDALDPRLIPFMVHDRVTAAGTTMSIGLLYLGLAVFGVRTGERWASRAILISSVIGFASYWLWLRLGYFEPLHALMAVVLLPPFIVAARASMATGRPARVVDVDDAVWRRSLVAQLLFVVVGFGFVIGGVTISIVGVTSIFVQTDLAYLCTTASALATANPHLIPLIAHDRAGFGGALAADGLALALTALWGFRRGTRWLWWTLLVSGIPGFAATLGVHAAVGYTDFWHLAPVNFALVLYVIGLVLGFPYLCARHGTRGSGT